MKAASQFRWILEYVLIVKGDRLVHGNRGFKPSFGIFITLPAITLTFFTTITREIEKISEVLLFVGADMILKTMNFYCYLKACAKHGKNYYFLIYILVL